MKRTVSHKLLEWKADSKRKPLIIRGARQVGKTFVVRQLGQGFRNLVEINFEFQPEAAKVFEKDLDPYRISRDLSLLTGEHISAGETLLFLDEIQECPQALKALRYFYEMMPDLHVIAAGSLIEFELEKIGIPVGRINSIYMYPLSFIEFLKAKNEDLLLQALLEHDPQKVFPETAHRKLLNLLGEYFTVGGMPEAVADFIENQDFNRCFDIHHSIVETFRQDFNKYVRKYQLKYVELLFVAIPTLLGKKFKFSRISDDVRARELRPSLDLLQKAGIIHKVMHSSGQGIPLGATARADSFKVIFLDIALSQSILKSDRSSWLLDPASGFINKGEITEAFIGQELLAHSPQNQKSDLYYWQREARSSNAEVDYLVESNRRVLPVEVKSGPSGGLKSLRLFLDGHTRSKGGIRFSPENFLMVDNIHNYPLYAVFKLCPHHMEAIEYLLS